MMTIRVTNWKTNLSTTLLTALDYLDKFTSSLNVQSQYLYSRTLQEFSIIHNHEDRALNRISSALLCEVTGSDRAAVSAAVKSVYMPDDFPQIAKELWEYKINNSTIGIFGLWVCFA